MGFRVEGQKHSWRSLRRNPGNVFVPTERSCLQAALVCQSPNGLKIGRWPSGTGSRVYIVSALCRKAPTYHIFKSTLRDAEMICLPAGIKKLQRPHTLTLAD